MWWGGVLRDDLSRFCFGFSAFLGSCSITEAELWAILKGLHARSKGFQKIIVETDFLAAKNLILGDSSVLHPCFNLVKEI